MPDAVHSEVPAVRPGAAPGPGTAESDFAEQDATSHIAHGGRLFRRYVRYLAGLVSAGLLTSGGIAVYFSYQDTRALVDDLQREKAQSAATRIEQFVQGTERQLRGAASMGRGTVVGLEQRHVELSRLLRLSPAVSDAAWLDPEGRERVRVSRMGRDVVGSDLDRSSEPGFVTARAGRIWHGGVDFRRESEPHLAVMVPGIGSEDGVVLADINLRFVTDVVSAIEVGTTGHAYVVDGGGRLIAHRDPARVLRMTSLAESPPVRAALAAGRDAATGLPTIVAQGDSGTRALTAHASIAALGWHVLVEQPLAEAFAPMYGSLVRAAFLLLAGIILAIAASLVLARRMAAPVRILELGAQRIGNGHLNERVEVATGDELERLANQFNRMADRLHDSYSGLERRIAERTRQLEEANQAKGRFLAAASHDLRQPVHALGLFVAQLKETHDPGARMRLIERVDASATAVSDLIEALLDISKLDAGVVETRPADFALQTLLDRVEHALAPAAQAKGLRLRIRPTVHRVHTDPLLLERILANLCANAIRYTVQGGAIVTSRVRNHHVRIQVWDTGIGIALELQPHVFEEFFQIGAAARGESKGLGLGLAIVDRLATLLGTRVTMRSQPGRGSVFTLDVPCARTAAGAVERLAAPALATRFDGLPVLLIDDDATAREATEGVLTQWGCSVLSASNGKAAVELMPAAAGLPRLVICDYRLGAGELGTDVIRTIRSHAGADIPAVIVSADAGASVREAAATAGLRLMHKPLNAARLRALLTYIASAPGRTDAAGGPRDVEATWGHG